jgi:NAD(P)-dependent dehydrogenase (short-subunit alcohol dehydrogenase family)
MDLQGQRVIVLGSMSGIGLATAAAAARQGATVTVVSSRRNSVDKALAVLPAGATGRAVYLGRLCAESAGRWSGRRVLDPASGQPDPVTGDLRQDRVGVS